MSLEDMLKEEIKSQFNSIKSFSETCDIPYSTITNIFKRSLGGASFFTVRKICIKSNTK